MNGAWCCCRQYIQSLPAAEDPEVFGMHENANIAYELRETRRVLDTVLAMQPRLGNTPGSTSPDQQVTTIAASILDRFALIACLCSTHTHLLLSLEPNRIFPYVCLLDIDICINAIHNPCQVNAIQPGQVMLLTSLKHVMNTAHLTYKEPSHNHALIPQTQWHQSD